MYHEGVGVEKNMDKAIYWYEKVANKGHREAQLQLGVIYYKGFGVKKNLEKARLWTKKSATLGHMKAQEFLEFLNNY